MHIAIIGNGISGVTAARFIRKRSDHQITLISAETDYFFSRTALMYVYMGHLRFEDTQPYEPWFWKKNRIDLLKAYVTHIDSDQKKLHFADNNTPLFYDKLIIACGSQPNKFGWKGQNLQQVRGLYSYQDLKAMEKASQKGIRRAVIVGGGLIGIEMAEMFHARHIPVTMLVRETSYWNNVLPKEESQMVNRHIREHGIDLQLNTELDEIIDDGTGTCAGVVTQKGASILCDYVGLTAGVSPNIDFLKNTNIKTRKGVLVNEYLQTNIPDVYAIGDCAELQTPTEGRRAIEAIWYTGRMMGETVAQTICDKPTPYQPRLWFNSAKFLDIEYQVYGTVLAHPPAHHQSIYWEHPNGKKAIRIMYDVNTDTVLGFNLMGIRYRHEVCEQWIQGATPIQEVLQNLALANFDPEFFKMYEQEVIAIYEQQTGQSLQSKRRRSWNQVFRFLHKNPS